MLRLAIVALCSAACGRAQGVTDQELPGLVVEARKTEAAIDVELAAKDPAELGRALAQPYRVMLAAVGPHSAAINSVTTVTEAGKPVSELSDHAQIDNGETGTYRAVYTNSADYGRETTFVGGKLYLRPRYQRWHARAPEAPDEPAALRDQYAGAAAAIWELVAPGVELTDRGPTEIAGRPGRKIEVKRASDPDPPGAEPLAQRKWRESRSVEAVAGDIVLDTDKGVPLAVKLTGTIGFSRDGRKFAMTVSVDSTISGVGSPAAIAAPPESEVVATPERLREVDDRDYLLQGIAPPLRRNPDGTAVPPAPSVKPGGDLPDRNDRPDRGDRGDRGGRGDKPHDRPSDKPGDPAVNRKTRSDEPARRRATAPPPDGARP